MRRPIIAGNWKMHKTIVEAIDLVNRLKRELYALTDLDIVVCPPFTSLSDLDEILEGSNLALGAQDIYWETSGAYTGEVSAAMLKDAGCEYVICGHSERRNLFFETSEQVNKKARTALAHGLSPIVCVGENLKQREEGRTFEVVREQLIESLKDLTEVEMLKVVLAYEPVWAIGTGKTATPQQAQEAQSFIRNKLSELYNEGLAQSIRIQYGGSVRPDNIADLMSQEDMDGALVGGASLDAGSFIEIVKRAGGR